MTAAVIDSPREFQAPKPPDGLGIGAALAILVHVLLVAALAFGVSWRTHEPETVAAELWSAVPQMAAPRAVAPPPAAPPPVPEKRVAPAPQPTPQPAPPPTARLPDAQISIERQRQEARRQAEQREAERIAAQRQKVLQEKAQQEKLAAEQAQREAARREQSARDAAKREQVAREAEARQKRELAEKDKRDEAVLQAQREANLRRIQGQAGATSDDGAGTAARASGPSSGYEARIMARILPKIVYPDSASESKDLVASVEVRCSPDGTILSRKLLRASGKPAWDDAVLRAIDKTEMLPRDIDGRVPPVLLINFRPHN
jgi:colicin import membrane protein